MGHYRKFFPVDCIIPLSLFTIICGGMYINDGFGLYSKCTHPLIDTCKCHYIPVHYLIYCRYYSTLSFSILLLTLEDGVCVLVSHILFPCTLFLV